MNNEMTLNAREMKFQLVLNQVLQAVRRPLSALTYYYNKVLERPVSDSQTLHLLNVQMAFIMTVFVDSPVLVRLLCLCWLVASFLKCREALS